MRSSLQGGGHARRPALAAAAAALALLCSQPASAHVVHSAAPGESLWSIAAANGMTADALAAANGLSPADRLTVGQEISLPAATGSTGTASPEAQGMVAIHHPSATPYLAPEAAAAWEAMREESLAIYGVDLYPIGSRSGYRTYEQQAYFFDLYLSGLGNPANPPGSSSHESGNAIDLATLEMRQVIDEIGAAYGWAKVEAPSEWWHINYVGGYGG